MDLTETALSILPPRSRAKLERLISDRELAHAALRAASDVMQDARREHYLAEAAARERLEMPQGMELHHPAAALARPTKTEVAERNATEARLLAPVETAKRRLDLAVDAHERATAQWQKYAFLNGVRQWLERAAALGIGHLEHFAPSAPKAKDIAVSVAALRAELVDLDAAWTTAENATVPVETLREMAIAEIDAVAQKGAINLDPHSRAGNPLGLAGAIKITSVPVMVPGDDRPTMMLRGDGGGALFAWLMRDALVARVDDLLAALPQAGALTDDEREIEFRRVSVRRLEIERQEEALVVAAEREGRVIARRRDLDPRALLEVVEA